MLCSSYYNVGENCVERKQICVYVLMAFAFFPHPINIFTSPDFSGLVAACTTLHINFTGITMHEIHPKTPAPDLVVLYMQKTPFDTPGTALTPSAWSRHSGTSVFAISSNPSPRFVRSRPTDRRAPPFLSLVPHLGATVAAIEMLCSLR